MHFTGTPLTFRVVQENFQTGWQEHCGIGYIHVDNHVAGPGRDFLFAEM